MRVSHAWAFSENQMTLDFLSASEPSPVPTEAKGHSALAAKAERVILRLARARLEMPNNPQLGEMLGVCRQSAAKALDRLIRSGAIRLERRDNQRRFHVNGMYTGWGEAMPGHAPFCTTPKGQPRLPRRKRAEPTAPIEGDWIPPVITERRVVSTASANTCQWPMWGDNERATGIYCGEPSFRKSLCAKHLPGSYIAKR